MPLRGGPVPPKGGPCAAERRPLCREEALCAGRYSVLRGLEEALCRVGSSCAERRPSVLVGPVLCAESIEGGPCVGKSLTVPNGSTPLC